MFKYIWQDLLLLSNVTVYMYSGAVMINSFIFMWPLHEVYKIKAWQQWGWIYSFVYLNIPFPVLLIKFLGDLILTSSSSSSSSS
jgi:hypothetical protein